MRPFVELILYEKSIMRKQLRQSSHQPKAKGMRQERSGRGGRGRGRRGEQKRRKKKWKKNTRIKLNKNLIYVMRWLKHKHVDWILNWRKKKNSRGHWRKFFFFPFFFFKEKWFAKTWESSRGWNKRFGEDLKFVINWEKGKFGGKSAKWKLYLYIFLALPFFMNFFDVATHQESRMKNSQKE